MKKFLQFVYSDKLLKKLNIKFESEQSDSDYTVWHSYVSANGDEITKLLRIFRRFGYTNFIGDGNSYSIKLNKSRKYCLDLWEQGYNSWFQVWREE